MSRFPFFRKKADRRPRYDTEALEPVIRCSICNGEQTAGFRDRRTGRFEEISLIRTPEDIEVFRDRYGIEGEIKKIY